VGWNFVPGKTAWISELSVQQDLSSIKYRDLFLTVLAASVFGTGVLH
jgi:hypothetical protein